MIQKYLPDTAARVQAEGFQTSAWVKKRGVHANLNNLIQAYQTIIGLYKQSKYEEGDEAWIREVGKAQCSLPAHVVNEYCRPTLPLCPLPDFTDASPLPRARKVSGVDWFTGLYNDGNLGKAFAVYRDNKSSAKPMGTFLTTKTVYETWPILSALLCDCSSMHALATTRIEQRRALVTQLNPKNIQDYSELAVVSIVHFDLCCCSVCRMASTKPLTFQNTEQIVPAVKPRINIAYQYEDNDIQAILAARLQQLRKENSQLFIKPIGILAAIDNIIGNQLENRLRQEAKDHHGARILLIPCNLENAHWVGMLIAFGVDEKVLRAQYIDSFTTCSVVPQTFQEQLQKVYPGVFFESHVLLQQNDYTSCGAYTIENLLLAALGIQSLIDREIIRHLHLKALK